jgi:hypothetical protein
MASNSNQKLWLKPLGEFVSFRLKVAVPDFPDLVKRYLFGHHFVHYW